jgi:hypothetical protein
MSGTAAIGAAFFNLSVAHGQRGLPKSEYDYVDWSWEKWRRITGLSRPRISGAQAGKAELVDLLNGNQKITTAQASVTRREENIDQDWCEGFTGCWHDGRRTHRTTTGLY